MTNHRLEPEIAIGQRKAPAESADSASVWEEWPQGERELLSQIIQAVRTIRYGSIVLTIHDGQLVEISKNIRIRRNRSPEEITKKNEETR